MKPCTKEQFIDALKDERGVNHSAYYVGDLLYWDLKTRTGYVLARSIQSKNYQIEYFIGG